VIHGFTRSFGLRLSNGERYEWVKPIMFSAGVGQLDGGHTDKGSPENGMLVVKVGGPAYRIGIGMYQIFEAILHYNANSELTSRLTIQVAELLRLVFKVLKMLIWILMRSNVVMQRWKIE
jgi:phosphoribosylformylglycinamidine (FGAM) synthase-like enzyme